MKETAIPTPTIYFIRHGETDWNAEARLQGQRNTPLNPRGLKQAREVGRKLKTLAPDRARLDFICSPLQRTLATMEIVLEEYGAPADAFRTDERLKEIAFGAWEGKTWPEIAAEYPQELEERRKDRWYYSPPGGGESYAMVQNRVMDLVRELRRDTVLVSHGGVGRAMLVALARFPRLRAPLEDIVQGHILVFEKGRVLWV
ncbi:MAG: histidine phosphatase family protein [Methylobacteriaceae bacterium]|nr:histidine phosphatase family protein [Methylobacteriaceae bacterium]